MIAGLNSNPGPTEYKAVVLTTQLGYWASKVSTVKITHGSLDLMFMSAFSELRK